MSNKQYQDSVMIPHSTVRMSNTNRLMARIHPALRMTRQAGLSLIELLLAAVLGVFVMGGLGTVYISSQHTYALRAQIAEMDANARIALQSLKEHLSHAGYYSQGQGIDHYVLPDNGVVKSTPCIRNTSRIYKTKDRGGIAGDTIGVAFVADGWFSGSCLGNGKSFANDKPLCTQPDAPTLEHSRWYNSFAVNKSSRTVRNSLGETIPQLSCGSSTGTTRSSIALGVESMQLRYGVDSDDDQQVDAYLNATEVAADNHWNNVLLIQVALLVRSIEPVFSKSQRNSYQLLDKVISPSADRYKRSVYTTMIRLPNVAHPLI